MRVPVWLDENFLPASRPGPSHMVEGARELSEVSFIDH